MNAPARMLGVAVLAWLGLAGAAAGQAGPLQTGHALDANPAVGGSGINLPVAPPGGLGSQYLITGQGRLGRSFRGFMPYSSPSFFQGSLGSAALFDFNRDSVGLPMVTQTGVGPAGPGAMPFVQTPRTVFTAGDVPRGQPTGAGLGGDSGVLNPFAQPQYVASPSLPPTAADPGGYVLTVPAADPAVPLSEQLDARQELIRRQQQWAEVMPGRLTQPAGPGTAPSDPPADGPDPWTPLVPLEPVPSGRLGPVDGRAHGQLRVQPESAFPGPLGPQTPLLPDAAEPPAVRPLVPPIPDEPGDEPGAADRPDPPAAAQEPAPGPAPGDDLYSDLLRWAKELNARMQADEPEPSAPTPTTPGELLTRVPPLPGAPPGPGTAGPPDATPAPPPAPVIDLGVSYESFASASPSRASEELRRAEELMRQGRFYQSLDRLARARQWDPGNPLIWLRASHAYVGAGEFYSAAVDLRLAIRIFPSVVSVRTDLAALLGSQGQTLLHERMAQLERIAQDAEGTSRTGLSMLLCYLEHLTGRTAQAERTARALGADSAADPEASALVRYVLGQASPPTTQPDRR